MKQMRRLAPLLICLVLVCFCRVQASGSTIAKLLVKARPGQTVKIPSGTYIEDVIVPAGVSITGRGPGKTLIVGSVQVSGTPEHGAELSHIRIIHTGGGNTTAVKCNGGSLTVHHSFVSSEGGFAAIGVGRCQGRIFNNIIVGPVGDYAIFGRDGAKIDIVNNTIVVQGFGVGLMDKSYATIRNCLFYGETMPAVIRTDSDYAISYTNISGSGASYYFGSDLINNDVRMPAYNSSQPVAKDANKDVSKYDSAGLTFIAHPLVKYPSVDEFRKNQPVFAVNAGSSEKTDNNADGTRNHLGAFGGPEGARWR